MIKALAAEYTLNMNSDASPSTLEKEKEEEEKESKQNGQPKLNGTSPSEEDLENPFFVSDAKIVKKKGLPPWLNHFNAKDLKILFKCSVAVWIATLLIFINPTLDAFGQATFFGCILLFIVPCSGIVFVHIMGGVTMILGMALGWAWGVISMKAALATRPAAETNARLAQLSAQARHHQTNTEQATGQSAYTQILIFEGFMLDTRVTITYFCMVGSPKARVGLAGAMS